MLGAFAFDYLLCSLIVATVSATDDGNILQQHKEEYSWGYLANAAAATL